MLDRIQEVPTSGTTRTVTPTLPPLSARTSRDLYAEARRYVNWARNVFHGYSSPVDVDGRTWTLDEIYAHMWTVRRAGNKAEARENAARQAADNLQRAMSAADERAHAAASHVRVVHDAPPAPALVALLDSTRGVVARWEAEQIAADIAAYVAAGGAEGNVIQFRPRRKLTGVAA